MIKGELSSLTRCFAASGKGHLWMPFLFVSQSSGFFTSTFGLHVLSCDISSSIFVLASCLSPNLTYGSLHFAKQCIDRPKWSWTLMLYSSTCRKEHATVVIVSLHWLQQSFTLFCLFLIQSPVEVNKCDHSAVETTGAFWTSVFPSKRKKIFEYIIFCLCVYSYIYKYVTRQWSCDAAVVWVNIT